MLAQNETQSLTAYGDGAEDVLQSLRSQSFNFGVLGTGAPAYVSAGLSDTNGYQLFWAFRQTVFAPQRGGGVWLADPDVSLHLATPAPIFVGPALVSARTVVTNSQGQILGDVGLTVQNGYLLYPTNLVGRTGSLVLGFRGSDGGVSTVAFSLADGRPAVSTPATGFVGIGIENDYNFGLDPANIGLYGVDIRSALVRFTVDTPGGLATKVGGRSPSGEVPVGFLIRARPFSIRPGPLLKKKAVARCVFREFPV